MVYSTGRWCQYESCDTGFVCNNNGTCDVATGACHCSEGYGDPYCNTLLCDVIPCMNNGAYIHGHCACAVGYTGLACEFSICDVTLCLNDGTCVPETGQCYCGDYYTGLHCERYLELCSTDCGVNGACQYGQCMCFEGFGGESCKTKITEVHICLYTFLMIYISSGKMEIVMFYAIFVHISQAKFGQPLVGTWMMSDNRRHMLHARDRTHDPVMWYSALPLDHNWLQLFTK